MKIIYISYAVVKTHWAISGDYSEGVPPVLIPNTAVKPFCAEDTRRAADRESRTLPDSITDLDIRLNRFLFFPAPDFVLEKQNLSF